jgi:hypothetical protein
VYGGHDQLAATSKLFTNVLLRPFKPVQNLFAQVFTDASVTVTHQKIIIPIDLHLPRFKKKQKNFSCARFAFTERAVQLLTDWFIMVTDVFRIRGVSGRVNDGRPRTAVVLIFQIWCCLNSPRLQQGLAHRLGRQTSTAEKQDIRPHSLRVAKFSSTSGYQIHQVITIIS